MSFKIVSSKRIDEKGEFLKKIKDFFTFDSVPTFKLKEGDKVADYNGDEFIVIETDSVENRAESEFIHLKLKDLKTGEEASILTGSERLWAPITEGKKKLGISKKKLTESNLFNAFRVILGHGKDEVDGILFANSEEEAKQEAAKLCPHCEVISAEEMKFDDEDLMWIDHAIISSKFEKDLGWDNDVNEALDKVFTVMFFHNGDTYTGIIYADSENDAKEKFTEYCPSCSIDRIKKGRLGFEYPTITPTFEEDMGWTESEDKYEVIDSKSVRDSDGFYTDYTLYYDKEQDLYICIFGDMDLYTPENSEPDVEFETEREAIEWFNNYNGFEDDDLDESWGWNKHKKLLVYNEEDIPDVAYYLMNRFPDETAGWEAADIKSALYALHGDIKGIEGLPFSFDMEEDDDDLIEDYETEDSIKISQKTRKDLNKICQKYCGWKLPEELRHLWTELYDAGIDPFMIAGYPNSVAEDGGKSWEIDFTMHDKDVVNSRFIYQVYEGNGDSLKNEYNIYFS